MKILNTFLLLFVLAFGTASAGEMYSPAFQAGTNAFCTLLNVGPIPISFRIEWRNVSGGIIQSFEGEVDPYNVGTMTLGEHIGYCAFFFDGSPKSVRAGVYTWSASDGQTVVLSYAK